MDQDNAIDLIREKLEKQYFLQNGTMYLQQQLFLVNSPVILKILASKLSFIIYETLL